MAIMVRLLIGPVQSIYFHIKSNILSEGILVALLANLTTMLVLMCINVVLSLNLACDLCHHTPLSPHSRLVYKAQ